MEFVGMFTMSPYIWFLSCHKHKDEYRLCVAAMLLFHIVCKVTITILS